MKNGFTLIELMTTLAILAIVVAFGVPSFSYTIKNNRQSSQLNTLISAINYARTEAVKRDNQSITICGSSDQASCNTSQWEKGWIIFVDANNNGSVDSGESILRINGQLSGGNTLRTSGFPSNSLISFNAQGMLPSSGTFRLCDDRGATSARALVLNLSGQTRLAADEDSTPDGIVNDNTGANVTCP